MQSEVTSMLHARENQTGGGLRPLWDMGLSNLVTRSHVCISQLRLHNKIPQIRAFKQQEFFFSRSWRLQVQDQGAGGIGYS